MSRAIKFRAWDKQKKCFVDFDNPKNGMQYQCRKFRVSSGWDSYKEPVYDEDTTDNFIIEQFTGLLDRNGKEIYEGDIVSCYSLSGEYGALFVVKYGKLPDICGHEYCPCLQGFYLDEIDEYEEVDEEGYIEVIGNVHEYPELLGEEK